MAEALTFGLVVTDKGTAVVKRFGRNVTKVGRSSEKAASRMIRAFTAFRGSLTGTIGAVISLKGAIIGAGLGFFAKSILNAGGAVESARLRLVGMKGSIDAAAESMRFFEEVAAAVPFTLEKVIEAGVTLEAFGAKSEETLRPVSDLAAFMGIEIPEAARAFGRAFAGGVGAADVLRERGVLTLVRLRTGIDDLTKLSLPQFREALLTAMRDPTGPIADAAKRLASSWKGQISIMQDAIFQLQKTIAEAGILELAKEVIGELTLSIKGVTAALKLEQKQARDVNDEFAEIIGFAEIGIIIFEGLRRVIDFVALGLSALLAAETFAVKKTLEFINVFGVFDDAIRFVGFTLDELIETTGQHGIALQESSDRQRNAIEIIKNLRIQRAGELAALKAENAALGENAKKQETANDALSKRLAFLKEEVGLSAKSLPFIFKQIASEESLAELRLKAGRQLEEDLATAKDSFDGLDRAQREVALSALIALDPKKIKEFAQAFIESVNAVEETSRKLAATIAANASTTTSSLTAVSQGFRTRTVGDVANFGVSLNSRIEKLREAGATEEQIRKVQSEGALFIASTTISQLGNIITQGGRKNLALVKAFAVAEAIVNTAKAITEVLPNLPLAGLIGALGAAQIATILAAKPGGGAPSVGGGAFGGGAPAAPIEAAPTQAVPSVNITVQGFIGDEGQLTSELARLVREGVGDDVDFGLEVR